MFIKSLALVALTLSLSAHAAIVDLGNITRDSDTGLDWLDVTFTQQMTYGQAEAAFPNWRHATIEELDTLVTNFGYIAQGNTCEWGDAPGIQLGNFCDTGPGTNEPVRSFINLLGDLSPGSNGDWNCATGSGAIVGIINSDLYSSPFGPEFKDAATISDCERIGSETAQTWRVVSAEHAYNEYGVDPITGNFMVRETPIPAAAWLFGSALAGLFGVGRMRKKAA